ncbi:MAG: hypothetical protein HYZ28_13055 [Myxococcales bacterium]|nr:hypothetical protein [Myxococcales bacterium]
MPTLPAALALLLSQTGTPMLRVQPEAIPPCAHGIALLEAIRTRSPGVLVAVGQPTGDDLSVAVKSEGASWMLTVQRPGGDLAMQRQLDAAGLSCEQLSDIAALILDRFLLQIEWKGRPEELPPLPPPPLPEPPVSPPPLFTGLEASLGPALRAGLPISAEPFGSLEVGTRSGAYRASLALWGGLSSRTPVEADGASRGVFRRQSFLGLAALGYCAPLAGMDGCAGLTAGLELATADAQGQYLYRRNPQAQWLPSAGGMGRLCQPLPFWGLFLSADLAFLFSLGSSRLEVEGTGVGYSPPSVGALASLRLGRRFF